MGSPLVSPGHDVVAVVLTHRRPKLATEVVRGLLDEERLEPEQVLLVVNEEGGLTDPELERSIAVLRLEENTGPAGGFGAGLVEARRRGARWIYLCEDDVGLFDLPPGRVADLVQRADAMVGEGRRVGAIVAYGRDVDPRTGTSIPHDIRGSERFEPVDVAAWGASLVSSAVVDASVLPDPALWFAHEDHDFWLRVHEAGFDVLVDAEATKATQGQVSGEGRVQQLAPHRPAGREEGWRLYYQARNMIELARRHGSPRWILWHLAKSVRRAQRNGFRSAAPAIVRGLLDGWRRRLGRNDRYLPPTGER